ncbi:MAG: DUF853 family protein [Fimbriimonadaceae bacterium]|nr:DUF853 family protein [Fimbriimonadaceae bacterium]
MSDGIFVGKGENPVYLLPKMGNRHGMIAGATGTGKTVTLQILAEGFSSLGVPVFMADVKGDLSGMACAGGGKPKLEERATQTGLGALEYAECPVIFWDLYGEKGHRIRTTITEMGPVLLSRLMQLNETQEGVLTIAFRIADDQGLLLLDLKDLRSILTFVSENAKEIQAEYGNVSPATVGAIQRALLQLEEEGADNFFGEPALDISDLMRVNFDGRGIVNILAADRLMNSRRTYATFLLWLLSELFEELPEVGDMDKPKLVFFFDEAHLLFSDAPAALVEKVEQVVRLIRSKGVGVYFVTQNPLDIPDTVLGQLGNRVQHALRAFTPRDQKAVKSAASTFRQNPAFDTETVITELGVGEALVSLLDEKGAPTIVERTLVRPPLSRLGPATETERSAVMNGSPVAGRYDKDHDPESAYEILSKRAEVKAKEAAEAEQAAAEAKEAARQEKEREKQARVSARARPAARRSDSAFEAGIKSVMRSAGSQVGREIIRGVLGGLFRGR